MSYSVSILAKLLMRLIPYNHSVPLSLDKQQLCIYGCAARKHKREPLCALVRLNVYVYMATYSLLHSLALCRYGMQCICNAFQRGLRTWMFLSIFTFANTYTMPPS